MEPLSRGGRRLVLPASRGAMTPDNYIAEDRHAVAETVRGPIGPDDLGRWINALPPPDMDENRITSKALT